MSNSPFAIRRVPCLTLRENTEGRTLKVLSVLGTRPEAIKLAPVSLELRGLDS